MWNIKTLALTVQKAIYISKVKVFKKWVNLQGQGHEVKNNGTHGEVLNVYHKKSSREIPKLLLSQFKN